MSDDEYEIPLQDQRAFGAGIKRQKVHFVPSSSTTTFIGTPAPKGGPSVSDRYLSLVLPSSKTEVSDLQEEDEVSVQICEVCFLPLSNTSLTTPHAASLAHQVCLTHSHPPSHLDRRRKGMQLLQSQGWDPDARRGLGASEQGIRFPVKATPKDDKLGLGVVLPTGLKVREKVVKLDAGKVRKLEAKNRKERQKVHEMFYRNDDVERLLRGDC